MSDRHYQEYGFVIGYMCLADYEELGVADDGNKVFPSVEDLKRGRPCVEGCGIVQVRVTATKIIQEPKWGDDDGIRSSG